MRTESVPGPPSAATPAGARRGVVIVVEESSRLLVIRRSLQVVAPGKICFPGGHIEAGESEPEAVVREFHEELGGRVLPGERIWQSVSPRGVHLAWWTARLDAGGPALTPNAAEVAEYFWWSLDEMHAHGDLLDSNRTFLEALAKGEILREC